MIIGTGIDIVEIERIRQSVEKYGDHFLEKIFTSREQGYCLKHKFPYPHFAARFAVKEAAFKALGTGWQQGVTWKQVEVENDNFGKPVLYLSGKALEICKKINANTFHVTISHSRTNAVAFVILENIFNQNQKIKG